MPHKIVRDPDVMVEPGEPGFKPALSVILSLAGPMRDPNHARERKRVTVCVQDDCGSLVSPRECLNDPIE
eukprot:1140046-Rhodomonas_salina.1